MFYCGVNVGGDKLLPMKELSALLQTNGFVDVSRYIQSGNTVLKSTSNPASKIRALVAEKFGFESKVLALRVDQFMQAVANNPFKSFEGKTLHFYFCARALSLDKQKLAKFASASERIELIDNVFYLHAPDGIGRSKLVANIESCLGAPATARNLNTVNKLLDMLAGVS
ncbi:MAG: hypothetical protein ACI8PV_001483 [Dinoroseobacter sp.]